MNTIRYFIPMFRYITKIKETKTNIILYKIYQ